MTTENTAFYTNVSRRGNNILLRYVDTDGSRKQCKVPYKPFFYIKSNENPTAKGMLNGEPLSRIDFDDIKSANEFLEKYRGADGFKIFGQKNISYQFISKYFGKDELNYDADKIRIGIYDIEVFSGYIDENGQGHEGPFPYPDVANYPVNAITLYDSYEKKYFVFGLEYFDGHFLGTYDESKLDESVKARVAGLNYEYQGFETEEALLAAFLKKWQECNFDVVSGFFNKGFDDPYMVNRINKVLGDGEANKLSPWGIINTKTTKDDYGKERVEYDFVGINILDYKDIVMKHGYIEPDNWKLNTVSDVIIGEGKIDYAEAKTLNLLYVNDYNKLIAYNMIDVGLIVKMENKKNFFPFLYFLTYMLRCNMIDTLATVGMWSAYAYNKLHHMGKEPEIKGVQESEDFVGGFVREPIKGKHGWGVSIDANSLYPLSGFLMFNMGPETRVSDRDGFKIKLDLCNELDSMISAAKEDSRKQYLGKIRKALKTNELMCDFYWDTDELPQFETLKKYNVCMAMNGVFFKNDGYGLWADISESLYLGRKQDKKEMTQAEADIEVLKQELKRRKGIY